MIIGINFEEMEVNDKDFQAFKEAIIHHNCFQSERKNDIELEIMELFEFIHYSIEELKESNCPEILQASKEEIFKNAITLTKVLSINQILGLTAMHLYLLCEDEFDEKTIEKNCHKYLLCEDVDENLSDLSENEDF